MQCAVYSVLYVVSSVQCLLWCSLHCAECSIQYLSCSEVTVNGNQTLSFRCERGWPMWLQFWRNLQSWMNKYVLSSKRAICKSQHTNIQLPTATNLKQFCWQIRKFGIVLQTHKFLEIFWHNNIYEPKYQDMLNFGCVYLRMFELPILVLYEKSSNNICVRISQEIW